MFHFKRLGALTLALALAATALTGCSGGGNSSASSSASGSSSQGDSSAQVESIDLAQVTDPYLTTSGLSGDTVVARIGDSDITAAEFLYWASYGTDLYLSQFGGYLTSVPWDTDLGGITMAEQMKESSLNAAAFYALLPVVAQQEGLSPPPTSRPSWTNSWRRWPTRWGARSWSPTSCGTRCSPRSCTSS